ncbi:MAG: deoxyribose-phosphate aldolase [Bacteroidales bacterium]|nr:deoxyribose-phosphate aldolase [Bacteroidales bacterium]
MNDLFEKYGYSPDQEKIGRTLELIASSLDEVASPDRLKDCFSLMDLTTLHATDTVASVKKLVAKVNGLPQAYPTYPLPASICVFPNFAATVARERKDPAVHVTAVAGCFPASQSFLEVKVRECELAVETGADEIDIVLALNAFLAGDYATVKDEIAAMRQAVDAAGAKQGRRIVLKVILETGLLVSAPNIAAAAFLAMEAGADFIKTSTGKVEVNATPMAAFVMCEAIKAFYAKTGRKVGFKAAGGISSAKDALCYYSIVSSVLGAGWLHKDFFRFGVSRLGNSLMGAIEQNTVSYF